MTSSAVLVEYLASSCLTVLVIRLLVPDVCACKRKTNLHWADRWIRQYRAYHHHCYDSLLSRIFFVLTYLHFTTRCHVKRWVIPSCPTSTKVSHLCTGGGTGKYGLVKPPKHQVSHLPYLSHLLPHFYYPLYPLLSIIYNKTFLRNKVGQVGQDRFYGLVKPCKGVPPLPHLPHLGGTLYPQGYPLGGLWLMLYLQKLWKI